MFLSLFALFARLLTGGVFLLAGAAKLKQDGLLEAILGYELLPRAIAALLTRFLPWVEIVVGLFLVGGLWSRSTVVLGISLFVGFSCVIVVSLWRGKKNPCGCFGMAKPIQWKLVWRNLILAGLLLPVYVVRGGFLSIDYWFTEHAQEFNDWNFEGVMSLVPVWLLAVCLSCIFYIYKFLELQKRH